MVRHIVDGHPVAVDLALGVKPYEPHPVGGQDGAVIFLRFRLTPCVCQKVPCREPGVITIPNRPIVRGVNRRDLPKGVDHTYEAVFDAPIMSHAVHDFVKFRGKGIEPSL